MRSVNRAYMISIGFSVQPQKIPRIHSDYIPSKYSVVSTFPSGLFSFLSYESVIFQKERKKKKWRVKVRSWLQGKYLTSCRSKTKVLKLNLFKCPSSKGCCHFDSVTSIFSDMTMLHANKMPNIFNQKYTY